MSHLFGGIELKKSERLNQELIFLSDKYSFQLKDLQAEFGISKRTALRDVEELESMGLALYAENGRHGGYKLINQGSLVPVYFNSEEIQAIFFSLKALDVLSSTPFKKSYTQIRQKLFATLSDERKDMISRTLDVIHYYNVGPINDLKNLDQILEATLEDRVVRAHYRQFEHDIIEIQILELFYRNGIWFVSAFDRLNGKWGTFRCDCMEEVVILEATGEELDKTELKTIQNEYEEIYHDIRFRCRLTDSGKETFKKNNYPNMKLEMIENIPYIIGGYNKEELNYMINYLLSFGQNITIEYPDELKATYLEKLNEIISRY